MNLTQNQAKELFLPLLKEHGRNFRSTTAIFARQAKEGESVRSAPGTSEEQIAGRGDFVCRNQAGGEEYLVQGNTFRSLYEEATIPGGETTITTEPNAFLRFNPKSQVVACEITSQIATNLSEKGLTLPCTIQNSNGNNVTLNIGDYVLSPLGTLPDGETPPVNGLNKDEFNTSYGG